MIKKTNLAMGFLVLLVVVLGGMVIYSFVTKPVVTGYVSKTYNQGASDVLGILLNQIENQGFAQIPISENQSIILVPYQQGQVQQAQAN